MSDASVGTVSIDLQLDDRAFDRALLLAEGKAQAAGRTIDDDLSGATKRTEARFASFGAVATKALAATGIAAGIAGAASVKMAGDFEQSLNVFKSVTGATAQQMAQVAARARELGKDISLPGISARDAAVAMTNLAKAGLDVNQSLAASKGVLSLAKAGNLDVADAASIAAKALNAFGLAGSEAVRVADLLAAAANASSADVADISLGLAQVGAGAKQMGVGLQDTIAALALFTNAGIRGQDAGTSLKQMFIQLASPTKQAGELMAQLGLDFFDAKGNFVGLEKSAGLLSTKLAGLTQEQRNNALATIFGSDSMRVAAILADQGAAGFDKMAKAVGRQGAATELAAAQNAGFNGALDNFKSTLETLAIDLGTKLLPPVTRFLQVLTDKLPAAVDFASSHFAGLVAVIGGLAAAVAAFKIAGFVQGFLDLVIALRGATVAAGVFSAVLDANPIGLIVLAVAALVAALVFLQLKFDIFGKAITALQPLFKILGQVFQAIADIFVASLQPAIGNLQAAFSTLWTALQPYVPYLKILAEVLGGAVVAAIIASIVWTAAMVSALANLIAIIIRVGAIIDANLLGAFRSIASTVNGVVKVITGINLLQAGKDLITGLINGIVAGGPAVIAKIREICGQAIDAIKKFFGIHSPSTLMAEMGENLMKGLADGITNAGSQATSAMTGVSQDLVAALNVPSGSFGFTGDASAGLGAGASRTLNQSNVFNVFNQVDPQLIANDLAWRAKRAG
jgi:TP901 family phage tail tape measure protein